MGYYDKPHLLRDAKRSMKIDSAVCEKWLDASVPCQKQLVRNFETEGEASKRDNKFLISELPEKYIEKVPFCDAHTLFVEAQKEFNQEHYAQAISKIESVLLWKDKGLFHPLLIYSLFLKAQCFSKLNSHADCNAILSEIHDDCDSLFTLKGRTQYRFLRGATYMHLKNYIQAHNHFRHLIEQRHNSVDEKEFDEMLSVSDFVQILIYDTHCLFDKIGLSAGEKGRWQVEASLAEAKTLLGKYPDIKNKEKILQEIHELDIALEKYRQEDN